MADENRMHCYQCFMVDHFAGKATALFWYEKDAKAYCAEQNQDCVHPDEPRYHYERIPIR